MSTPKYAVGDIVEFAGNKAVITNVHEEDYFFGTETSYYTYDLEYTGSGATQNSVTEAALQLIFRKEDVTVRNKLCECGAWATGFNKDEHSFWCPAYGMEPVKERK